MSKSASSFISGSVPTEATEPAMLALLPASVVDAAGVTSEDGFADEDTVGFVRRAASSSPKTYDLITLVTTSIPLASGFSFSLYKVGNPLVLRFTKNR